MGSRYNTVNKKIIKWIDKKKQVDENQRQLIKDTGGLTLVEVDRYLIINSINEPTITTNLLNSILT